MSAVVAALLPTSILVLAAVDPEELALSHESGLVCSAFSSGAEWSAPCPAHGFISRQLDRADQRYRPFE